MRLPDPKRRDKFVPSKLKKMLHGRYTQLSKPKDGEDQLLLDFAKSQEVPGAYLPEVAIGYSLGLEYLDQQGIIEEESQRNHGLKPSSLKKMFGQPGSLTADAVVVNGRDIVIIEVKIALDKRNDRGFKALGQVLTYEHLLRRDLAYEGLSGFEVKPAILTSKVEQRFRGVGPANGISIYLLE